MAGISWEMEDPIVEDVLISQDEAGFWSVSVVLREAFGQSLGDKVVRAKLIDQGRFFGKEIASQIWPVAATRQDGQPSKTTLTFNTGSTEYPDRTRVDFEFFEK